MMNLEKKAEKVNEEVKELMDLYVKSLGGFDMFENMDETQLKLMQKSISVFNKSLELHQEQAKVIDELDMKLDIIINKLNKNSEGKGL